MLFNLHLEEVEDACLKISRMKANMGSLKNTAYIANETHTEANLGMGFKSHLHFY